MTTYGIRIINDCKQFTDFVAICANSNKSLEELQESLYEYLLKENPEYASRIGDKRYDDQVDDFSLEVFDRWKVSNGQYTIYILIASR